MQKTKITILYPADPLGVIPGGIDTFIRGIIRWAPEDIDISLVGITTDREQRPLGRWTECDAGRRTFRFFPVAPFDNPKGRTRIPLVIHFMLGLIRYRPRLGADVLEFHRIEPSLLYFFDKRPKDAFFHQNMQILHNAQSDIMWAKLPGLYFWFQDKLLHRIQSMYAVRRDAVTWFQEKYPDIAGRFSFVPTWFDPEVFQPADPPARLGLRDKLGMAENEEVLVTVGRLDKQKNPLMLAKAFKRILAARPNARLWYIGDGVLREELENYIKAEGLAESVVLKGLKSPAEIAEIHKAADLFLLSSAYEGMPMCVLEALGSGLPVATTDVGEVGLVVKNGYSGEVIEDHSDETLANAALKILGNKAAYPAGACADAASQFTPAAVLEHVYENYRRLASGQ